METERPPFDSPERAAPGKSAEVHLTGTEARLLDVLQGHPGRVFSRAELVALVMPDHVVLERTIDVHIRALRRKLGSLPGGQIETVRKAGYRLTARPQTTEELPR